MEKKQGTRKTGNPIYAVKRIATEPASYLLAGMTRSESSQPPNTEAPSTKNSPYDLIELRAVAEPTRKRRGEETIAAKPRSGERMQPAAQAVGAKAEKLQSPSGGKSQLNVTGCATLLSRLRPKHLKGATAQSLNRERTGKGTTSVVPLSRHDTGVPHPCRVLGGKGGIPNFDPSGLRLRETRSKSKSPPSRKKREKGGATRYSMQGDGLARS